MDLWELFILAVGLSMDAFAVSICKGLSVKKVTVKEAGTAGVYFGGFQALMPLLGYVLGVSFQEIISSIDHWIAFILLSIIGFQMIRESKGEENVNSSFGMKEMIPLAVATSIDALAVGVTFAFLQVEIIPAVCMIGCVTLLFSAAGIWIGNVFGTRYKARAEIMGGVILIVIGLKILLEHLNIF
ncbi:MAG: manganese efflux pump MntP family protein [Eubacteriales bacterium]|nr:manganese efflux pump MntP family protein [Eubacteriales bacterium]